MSTALIVVDVQNDFCEGGSLAVAGGAAAASAIRELIESGRYPAENIVATKDFHIDPGAHFSDTPDFVDSWPPHCRAGTTGADFHPNLGSHAPFAAVFYKGQFSAAYSGFEGSSSPHAANPAGDGPAESAPAGVGLAGWLTARGITDVDVVGIATDFCVLATARDAAAAGFATRVLLEYTAAVHPDRVGEAAASLRAAGISVVD